MIALYILIGVIGLGVCACLIFISLQFILWGIKYFQTGTELNKLKIKEIETKEEYKNKLTNKEEILKKGTK